MTDGEIVREYNQAKDKKEQIKIMSELTLKPKEEIIRILKENGCEVEEKRRERKPKAETEEAPKVVRRRRRKTAQEEEKTIQSTKEQDGGTDLSAGKVKTGSSAGETTQGSSATSENQQGSSAAPDQVLKMLREHYEFLGFAIQEHRQKLAGYSKQLAEYMPGLDQIGIRDKDLVR